MSEGWRKVDELSRDLALAVRVTDAVTGGQPVGNPEVRIQGVDERPARNLSGYYLFFDLPEEEVTVTVDAGDEYHDASTKADLDPTSDDFQDPGEATGIALEPTPAYQFPAGLTRVRGTLLKTAGNQSMPVPGAEITVLAPPGQNQSDMRTVRTTDAGEFVYYFDDIDSSEVVRPVVDGVKKDKRVYRPGGSDPVFEVTAGGSLGQIQRSVTVEVGRLTTQNLNFQP